MLGSIKEPPQSEHFLGLIKPTKPNVTIESLRPLTQGEYDEYVAACQTLSSFVSQRPYVLARQMHSHFTHVFNSYETRLHRAATEGGPGPSGDVMFDINARLALWLESSRMFLNHTETTLKRRYGDSSSQWLTWKKTKGMLFDSEAAYRFMYHLRNYLHEEMPITLIRHSSWETEPGVTKSEFRVSFSRDDLLTGTDWKHQVKLDLQSMPPEFPVMPIAVRFSECLEVLLRVLVEIELPRAEAAALVIERLASEAMTTAGTAELDSWPIVLSEGAEAPLNLTHHQMPIRWVSLVREASGGHMTILDPGDI